MIDKPLRVENVEQTSKAKRGPLVALHDINLTVACSEHITPIGRSDCGKSTLLSLIAGLTRPTAGGLILVGHEIAGLELGRAMILQNHSLLLWFTCFDNVYLAVERVFGKSEAEAQLRDRTHVALAPVDLSHAEQKYPREISGGIKQRARIARALSVEPKVLSMDESFDALGALARAHLQNKLLEIVAATGSTVVMVTHDMDEAVLLADHIVTMTNRPAATIGEVLTVDLPRPRDRMVLAEDPAHHVCQTAVLDFLYRRQRHPVAEAA